MKDKKKKGRSFLITRYSTLISNCYSVMGELNEDDDEEMKEYLNEFAKKIGTAMVEEME